MNRVINTFGCCVFNVLLEVIALTFFSFSMQGQRFTEPSKLKQFNVTVNADDYTVKTQMLNQDKKIKTDNNKIYMWYTSQRIVQTHGGYNGKLIHGGYNSFYLNYQLKESGEIRYGLKHGEWKYWYPDGHLKEEVTWKRGAKNGRYQLYNDEGSRMAKGRFKNDKLHGKFYTYTNNGEIANRTVYVQGAEKIKQKTTAKKKIKRRLEEYRTKRAVKKKNRTEAAKEKSVTDNKKSFLETRKDPGKNFFLRNMIKLKKKINNKKTIKTRADKSEV